LTSFLNYVILYVMEETSKKRIIGDYMENTEAKIIAIIDKLRPFLISDGGNIEFVKFEDGIVYVKLLGACHGCPMMDITLQNAVEESIKNEIPEVLQVKSI